MRLTQEKISFIFFKIFCLVENSGWRIQVKMSAVLDGFMRSLKQVAY